MGVSFRIEFDRPNGVYFPGELVAGRVFMNVSKPQKATGVSVQIRGLTFFVWTESFTERIKKLKVHYEPGTFVGNEVLFDNKAYLLGDKTGEVDISPGDHELNFECRLPGSLLTSFEGKYGGTRYSATASLHRPWRLDLKERAAFTVISHRDLNHWTQAMRPASHKETKNFSWGASGALSVDVQLPLGGYVPGQTIFGQIQVDNGSNVRVERVVCTLHEEVKWTANRGSTTTVAEVTSSVFEGAVQAHSSKTISLAMPVPTVAPSKEALFSLIELKYFLRVTAEVSGYRGNLHCDLPVMVGTIPVFGPDDHKAEKSDRASPPRKTDLPPPTYEEADLKGKNKFVRRFKLGQAPYKPRYPVWDFSNVLPGK